MEGRERLRKGSNESERENELVDTFESPVAGCEVLVLRFMKFRSNLLQNEKQSDAPLRDLFSDSRFNAG